MSIRHQKLGALPTDAPKRPGKVRFDLWLEADLKAEAETLAHADGLTLSAFVRRMIVRKIRG
jgi:hypothetical protein